MITVERVTTFLEKLAPLELAEQWDNVGLLVGDPDAVVERVMTCLTITPVTADEARDEGCQLIVTHHPLPFRPLSRITTQSTTGRLVWQLAGSRIAVFSLHTAYDSAERGINQQWAERLGLARIAPLRVPTAAGAPAGAGGGRWGELPEPLAMSGFVRRVRSVLPCPGCKVVADGDRPVRRVALACGSAGEFLDDALRQGCDTMVTGETSFHTCLEAQARGLQMVLVGHFASERFGVEQLARDLQEEFPELTVWASTRECDPTRWMQ